MRHVTLCKAVAVITLVSLAVQARALIIVPLFERGGIGTQFVLMVLVILALAMASIVGLWRPRWWGFVAFYGYAITSTLLLGSALIPFVIGLSLLAIFIALTTPLCVWLHGVDNCERMFCEILIMRRPLADVSYCEWWFDLFR